MGGSKSNASVGAGGGGGAGTGNPGPAFSSGAGVDFQAETNEGGERRQEFAFNGVEGRIVSGQFDEGAVTIEIDLPDQGAYFGLQKNGGDISFRSARVVVEDLSQQLTGSTTRSRAMGIFGEYGLEVVDEQSA